MLRTLLLGLFLAPAITLAAPTAQENYQTHCLACHGENRMGAMAPALLPESLARLKKAEAMDVITQGRVATQMPGYADKLSAEEIKQLADWIYQPLAKPPTWSEADIKASQIRFDTAGFQNKPVFKADPLNVFLVVEAGDNHISVLDGDKLEVIHRFPTRFALHGGPKFTFEGRYVYWASRDGWVTKYDLWNLKPVAEIRAGLNTRNLAVSSDGRTVMVANYLPHTLVALNADDLSLVKVIPVIGENGKSSRVSAVYDARPRGSFIAALKDIPEAWEIVYDEAKGGQVYRGLVHDWQYGEGIPEKGILPIRTIPLDNILDDFFFDPDYKLIIGASRDAAKGQVVNLDVRRKIGETDLSGMPHLGSGIIWNYEGREVMATPNLKDPMVTVIDMKTWQTIKEIPTLGPGFFLRSHENTPYAWVDVFSGPNRDAMHVIDKRTLEIAATLRPIPGKASTHVEFDRYGKYALVSIWEMDGALVIYDAATLKEVKRLPMKKPVGKYNVWNKTRLSSGTSH
ncbi:MAG: cytochrome D1 domain-containing protein [Pseudomonadota bacterium]